MALIDLGGVGCGHHSVQGVCPLYDEVCDDPRCRCDHDWILCWGNSGHEWRCLHCWEIKEEPL